MRQVDWNLAVAREQLLEGAPQISFENQLFIVFEVNKE